MFYTCVISQVVWLPFINFSCPFIRPKWPSSSFASSDGLVTAMAYRLPHVVSLIYFQFFCTCKQFKQRISVESSGIDLDNDLLQVMGDRSGSIRWWDVTTGHSSSFNTHKEGIRRIKFSPVVPGDRSRGRIAVLFSDNTFSIFDLVSTERSRTNIFHLSVYLLYFESPG